MYVLHKYTYMYTCTCICIMYKYMYSVRTSHNPLLVVLYKYVKHVYLHCA